MKNFTRNHLKKAGIFLDVFQTQRKEDSRYLDRDNLEVDPPEVSEYTEAPGDEALQNDIRPSFESCIDYYMEQNSAENSVSEELEKMEELEKECEELEDEFKDLQVQLQDKLPNNKSSKRGRRYRR